MRFTILAMGSLGDVRPLVALGVGLRSAGHQVRLATHANFADLVHRAGLVFHPLPGDARSLLRGEAGLALAESGRNVVRNLRSVLRSFGALAQETLPFMADPALWEVDAVINQVPGGLFGTDLAEKGGARHFSAAVMPLVRTRSFPLIFFPDAPGRIPGYNALTYRLAEQLVWQPFRPAVNRWRKENLGLPPAPVRGVYPRLGQPRYPILQGFSLHVVPRPEDWGPHVHVTGHWFLEETGWQPPDSLEAFLSAGDPPVFVGFGSLPTRDPARVTDLVVASLRQAGQRGILLAGWAGLGEVDLPDTVYRLDYAPYAWLFPRLKAVVHHGGSGTTAEALRSGVPSLVVPFVMDQFYWGRRTEELGVGPRPIPFRRLTASRLAAALDLAAGSPEMHARAAELGARMRPERGVQRAVEVIEGYGSAGSASPD